MRIQSIYAAIATRDIARAETFYTTLFGRGPDDRPMDGLIQWRDVARAKIQLFADEGNAGSSMCTIVVPDMAEARAALEAAGLPLGPAQAGDFGQVATLVDPDGNRLTLAEPPRRG